MTTYYVYATVQGNVDVSMTSLLSPGNILVSPASKLRSHTNYTEVLRLQTYIYVGGESPPRGGGVEQEIINQKEVVISCVCKEREKV